MVRNPVFSGQRVICFWEVKPPENILLHFQYLLKDHINIVISRPTTTHEIWKKSLVLICDGHGTFGAVGKITSPVLFPNP